MKFRETGLAGARLIELEAHADERGFFARAFCEGELAAQGIPTHWPQSNLSRNTRAGTLRGLHYNAAPHAEAKIVRCVQGAIWDVIVDLRAGSPTRFKWVGVELTAEQGNALYIPEGFAHGFIALRDTSDVFYQMGGFFKGDAARGVRWNDPLFGITWPRAPTLISERDRGYPDRSPADFDG